MDRHLLSRRLAAVVVIVSLLSIPVGGSTVGSVDKETTDAKTIDRSPALQVTPQNNSTVQHRNPDEVQKPGDTGRIRAWLENNLQRRLVESAIHLREDDYQQAQALIGDQFDARLAQYVDVAGEVPDGTDVESGEWYRQIREMQGNLTTTVEEYERTYERYRQAARNGNESGARQIARKLDEIAPRVQSLNQTVQENYLRFANQTGASLTEPRQVVANISRNISARQERLDSELFVGTELRLDPDGRQISYTNPFVASGRLLTEDGTPIANRDVILEAYTHRQQVSTDGSGYFELRYRPRTIPVNQSSVTVTYIPDNTSEYQSTNATVGVSITQVEASLSTTVAPQAVGYGDTIGINATVSVDGERVSGLPIRATIGDHRLEANPLGETGNGTHSVTVPATISPGQQTLTVRAGNDSTAVTTSNATTPLSISETATNLTLERTETASSEIRLVGRLTTTDGDGIGNQTVVISVGGAVKQTIRTDSRGAYNATLQRSGLVGGTDGSVVVLAQYNGEETNLESTEATRNVVIGDAEESGAGLGSGLPAEVYEIGGIASLFLLLVSLVVARQRLDVSLREDAEPVATTGGTDTAENAQESTDGEEETDSERPTLDLAVGETLLEDGDEAAAIEFIYHRVREQVAHTVGVNPSDTHWEFFKACRDSGMDAARIETLRRLVEAYEQVNFLERPSTDIDVERLLQSVEEHWSDEDS